MLPSYIKLNSQIFLNLVLVNLNLLNKEKIFDNKQFLINWQIKRRHLKFH